MPTRRDTPMTLAEFKTYCRPEWRRWMTRATKSGLSDCHSSDFHTPAARRLFVDLSLIAHVRSAHINDHALRLIADSPEIGIVPRTSANRQFYLMGDRALVSFKKLDKQLKSRNIPTGQTEAFNTQGELHGLGDVTAATHIIAGYMVDAAGSNPRIYCTCPFGDTNLWVWRLDEPAASATLFDISPLAPPSTPAADPQRKLFGIKPGVRRKQDADGTAE